MDTLNRRTETYKISKDLFEAPICIFVAIVQFFKKVHTFHVAVSRLNKKKYHLNMSQGGNGKITGSVVDAVSDIILISCSTFTLAAIDLV